MGHNPTPNQRRHNARFTPPITGAYKIIAAKVLHILHICKYFTKKIYFLRVFAPFRTK